MNQEKYNEIMAEYVISEQKHNAEINRHNIRIIKALLNIKGFSWVIVFLKDYYDCECSGKILFTTKPKGEPAGEYWGASKGVYIKQHCEMEDSYYGNIYFPVKHGKKGMTYLECPFSC